MLLYILSFFMLLSPLMGAALLTSKLSARAKVYLFGAFALVLVLVPIAAFWLFGGSGVG
jgi:hypothetical protein